jgi:hypothetical protein
MGIADFGVKPGMRQISLFPRQARGLAARRRRFAEDKRMSRLAILNSRPDTRGASAPRTARLSRHRHEPQMNIAFRLGSGGPR